MNTAIFIITLMDGQMEIYESEQPVYGRRKIPDFREFNGALWDTSSFNVAKIIFLMESIQNKVLISRKISKTELSFTSL